MPEEYDLMDDVPKWAALIRDATSDDVGREFMIWAKDLIIQVERKERERHITARRASDIYTLSVVASNLFRGGTSIQDAAKDAVALFETVKGLVP